VFLNIVFVVKLDLTMNEQKKGSANDLNSTLGN